MVRNDCGEEHWSLEEVLLVLNQIAELYASLSYEFNQLIDLAFLDKIKDLLLE